MFLWRLACLVRAILFLHPLAIMPTCWTGLLFCFFFPGHIVNHCISWFDFSDLCLFLWFQNANTEFCQHKAKNTSGAQREALLKDLASGFDAFMDLKGNLEEGTKVMMEKWKCLKAYTNYSKSSMTQPLMAYLPCLIWTPFWVPRKFFQKLKENKYLCCVCTQ